MKITISGKSYAAACDPNAASLVPVEEGWPAPERRKSGKGYRFTYTGTRQLAEQIESHLRDVGQSLALYADWPEDRAEGRALLRDANRISALLATIDADA